MIIKTYGEHTPKLHPSVRVAETAAIIGNVMMDENVNVWYSAVVRGDMASISID